MFNLLLKVNSFVCLRIIQRTFLYCTEYSADRHYLALNLLIFTRNLFTCKVFL